MLRADDEKKDEKIDQEFDIIDEAEVEQSCEVVKASYPAAMLYGASSMARSGFGVGSIVGTAGAEALLYIAGSVASTAVQYAFVQVTAPDAPKNKIE